MGELHQPGDRALVAERGVGYFATLGALIGVPAAALIGVMSGQWHRTTAVAAGFEGILMLAWVGPVLGALAGVVNELTRPARQRRMLAKRDQATSRHRGSCDD